MRKINWDKLETKKKEKGKQKNIKKSNTVKA